MKFLLHIFAAGVALAISAPSFAAEMKVEDSIKVRQAGYRYMAWSMRRIDENLKGPTFNKDDVIKAANTIQAIANSGMGALFLPGTDKGTGWEPTRAKAEFWTEREKVGQVGGAFNKEANEMAKVAATGDAAAVKEQFGRLAKTCDNCHDSFKAKR